MSVENLNLDKKCFEVGTKIADEVVSVDEEKAETLIQKALGVLQEDGIFAFDVFLESKKDKEKEIGGKILSHIFQLVKDLNLATKTPDYKEALKEISNNLDNLILTKNLFEKSLVYARYHLKSK